MSWNIASRPFMLPIFVLQGRVQESALGTATGGIIAPSQNRACFFSLITQIFVIKTAP